MTPETTNPKPDFQRRPTGLVRGEEGQITVIFALLSMALVFFWMSVYQTGEVVSDRIKIQDTADACAYSGAVWGARMMNLIAYTNRAIIANFITITELVIARSHSKFWLDVAVIIELIAQALSWIPILGPILKVVATALIIIACIYEFATWGLMYALFRLPTAPIQGPKVEFWLILIHNLCALQNSVHYILAPPPVGGIFVDTGALSGKINNAVVPVAIKHTMEMIDPPVDGDDGSGRIWVNPAVSDGVPYKVGIMSQIFRQWTLQSYHDLLAWPAGKHGVERGNRKGEYEPGKRVYGTLCAYNKMIDQKWRLKWLIEKGCMRHLDGIWSWNRGAEGEGMSVLSQITNLWFVGIDIGGTTNVDEIKTGKIQVINFLGGKVFVRIAAPEVMQNDKDIEATDYLRVWYRQFWKLFSFPKKTLFQAGEIALLSEEAEPAFGQLSQTVGSMYRNNRNSMDRYKKTGYKGLPHEDNGNHWGTDTNRVIFLLGVAPNPLDHFLNLGGVDPTQTNTDKTVWRPTGIHEFNNDLYQQNSQNQGERAIWKSGGSAGYRGLAWMASNLPSYCYVLDARRKPSGGGGFGGFGGFGGGGDNRRFFIPKEDKRNQEGEQLGKRSGVVVTVAYKSAQGLKIVEIMGQGLDDAPEGDVTFKEQARTSANMSAGESLNSHPSSGEWEEKQVNLDMIRSGKFNSIGMSGLTAFAAAETYYENINNPEEPPNEMNPCWRARLTPMDRHFVAMLDGGRNSIQRTAMRPIKILIKGSNGNGGLLRVMKTAWRALGGNQNDIDETILMTH